MALSQWNTWVAVVLIVTGHICSVNGAWKQDLARCNLWYSASAVRPKSCVFPFSWNQVTYNCCIYDGIISDELKAKEWAWCAIKSNFDPDVGGGLEWAVCSNQIVTTPAPVTQAPVVNYNCPTIGIRDNVGNVGLQACNLPYTYNGVVKLGCEKGLPNPRGDSSSYGCSSTPELDAQGTSWAECAFSTINTAKPGGVAWPSDNTAACAASFSFSGVTYTYCTTAGWDRFWCSTETGEFVSPGQWRECTEPSASTFPVCTVV
jgi:hypothetical protein